MIHLVVKQYDNEFECWPQNPVGMCIVGRGKTVAEAVGDYCIFAELAEVTCDPPELLELYRAKKVKKFLPFPKRG